MSTSPEMAALVGVARVVPEVCTFVIPVFSNSSGEIVAQCIEQGRITGFEPIHVDEELHRFETHNHVVTVGDSAVYGIELSPEQFVVGSRRELTECLKSVSPEFASRLTPASVLAVSHFLSELDATLSHAPNSGFLFSSSVFSEEETPGPGLSAAHYPYGLANPCLKVIGIGGGGGNIINSLAAAGLAGVELMSINTDIQALNRCNSDKSVLIGANLTKGLGSGADAEIGRQAALEERNVLGELVEGCDFLIILASMGAGTGTGAAPIVAQMARELGIATVAIVTAPFAMEGLKRRYIAEGGISELRKTCDCLTVLSNESVLSILGPSATLLDAFKSTNQVIVRIVQSLAALIVRPQLTNATAIDIWKALRDSGLAMASVVTSSGNGALTQAIEGAMNSPLLNDVALSNARALLVNVSRQTSLSLSEFYDVKELIKPLVSTGAKIFVGTSLDPVLVDQICVTIVATGAEQTALSSDSASTLTMSPRTTSPGRGNRSSAKILPAFGNFAPPKDSPELDERDLPEFLRGTKNQIG